MLIRKLFIGLTATCCFLTGCGTVSSRTEKPRSVEFTVASDMRLYSGEKYSNGNYFDGACQAIVQAGPGEFMISPGDIDPLQPIRDTLDQYMGKSYVWYPVVGNHEAETPEDMEWLRSWGSNAIPGLVRRGPKGCETTTFSFDRGPVHFVVLNEYYDGTNDFKSKGDVVDPLYQWLKNDLEKNQKPMVLVVGHEPIVAVPDMDNGRFRHEKDSLNAYPENSQRFHQLLLDKKVTAYFAAHTHNTSITNMAGLWQIDSGHARGKGDRGAASTFLKVRADASTCTVEFHRQQKVGGPYTLTKSFVLRRP